MMETSFKGPAVEKTLSHQVQDRGQSDKGAKWPALLKQSCGAGGGCSTGSRMGSRGEELTPCEAPGSGGEIRPLDSLHAAPLQVPRGSGNQAQAQDC